jgi:hypothetical protein
MQVKQGKLPCTYLGLPLWIGRVRREDEQVLVDKVAGKLLNKSGRLTLVNSVLSSVVLYHMTVFPLSKWAIKKIDKIRSFMWHDSEDARSGHCLVNWRRVQRPKELGGLGVLDLQNFNTALRIRWQWYRWTDTSKPWSQICISYIDVETSLFRACTTIRLGSGRKVKFWDDRWLHAFIPKEVALALHRFALRKNISVADGLDARKWMWGLHRISTKEETN